MKDFLKRLWEGWKWFAQKVGFVNEHILLGLVYLICIGIYAVLKAPFMLFRRKKHTAWQTFEDNPQKLEDLNHMF